MAKFCGYCGSKLDEVTEKCPNPNCKKNISSRNDLQSIIHKKDNFPQQQSLHAMHMRENLSHSQSQHEATLNKSFNQQQLKNDEVNLHEKKGVRIGIIIAIVAVAIVLISVGFCALSYFDIVNVPFMNDFYSTIGIKDNDSTKEKSKKTKESNNISETDNKFNALMYIGVDIETAASAIGNMKSENLTYGAIGYTNGNIILETSEDDNKVCFISISGNSKYEIFGITVSTDINSARDKMKKAGYSEIMSETVGIVEFENDAGDNVQLTNSNGEVVHITYFKGYDNYDQQSHSINHDILQDDDEYTDEIKLTMFNSVSASSTLNNQSSQGKIFTYYAENLIDNDLDTCWAEGANGTGVGEKIVIKSATEQNVHGLYIDNGYCKNENVYNDNNRLKSIKISFDDGSYSIVNFADGYDKSHSQIWIDDKHKSVKTKTITIEILDVYKGPDEKDTCITEISVF